MNAALAVTWLRVAAVPALMALLLVGDSDETRWWALGVWIGAVLTDWVDGRLARSLGQVTTLGVFLDSLADKLLVSAALVCLVQSGDVSAWVTMIIIGREFAVTGLRLIAASEQVIIPASKLGKWKMVAQSVFIGFLIADVAPVWFEDTLLWVALGLTVLSGIYYFIVVRGPLSRPASAPGRPHVEQHT